MFLVSFAFKYFLIYLIEGLLGIDFSRKKKLFFLLYYVALYLVYIFVPYGFYDRHLTIALHAAAFAIEISAPRCRASCLPMWQGVGGMRGPCS